MSFNHFHQSVEDIIKSANPEQKIIWNSLFLQFGENISISQLAISGTFVASEISVYNARKLYFAYQLDLGAATGPLAFPGYISFFDQNNTLKFVSGDNSIVWNSTSAAVNYFYNVHSLKNIWFGRIVNTSIAQFNFIGFRIGI